MIEKWVIARQVVGGCAKSIDCRESVDCGEPGGIGEAGGGREPDSKSMWKWKM